VDQRKPPGGDRVGEIDREFPESAIPDQAGKVRRRADLAESLLDGDLPDRRGTDPDIRFMLVAAMCRP